MAETMIKASGPFGENGIFQNRDVLQLNIQFQDKHHNVK